MTSRRLGRVAALVAAFALLSSACSKATDEGGKACACEGTTPVDPVLVAFLSKAKALHHEADIYESQKNLDAAISALDLSAVTPVLKFTRRTFDAAGRPLEYVRSVYRADCFSMRVRLTLARPS